MQTDGQTDRQTHWCMDAWQTFMGIFANHKIYRQMRMQPMREERKCFAGGYNLECYNEFSILINRKWEKLTRPMDERYVKLGGNTWSLHSGAMSTRLLTSIVVGLWNAMKRSCIYIYLCQLYLHLNVWFWVNGDVVR